MKAEKLKQRIIYVNGIVVGMEGVHIILLIIPYAKSRSA